MFGDGAKLDDIINVLRRPTLDEEDKKDSRNSDAAIRYVSRKELGGCDTIKFEFAGQRNSEVLR